MVYRLAICIVLALLLAILSALPFGDRLEREIGLDVHYSVRGALPAPEHALIVGVDNKSIGWLQRNVHSLDDVSDGLATCLTPYARQMLERARNINHVPRALYVCLLAKLIPTNAELIVFDINFNAERPDDAVLADTVRDAGNVLLFERVGREGIAMEDRTRTFATRMQPVDLLRRAAVGTVGFKVDGSSSVVTTSYVTRFEAFPDLPVMPIEVWRRVAGVDNPPALNLQILQPIWLYGPGGTVWTVPLRDLFDIRRTSGLPTDLSKTVVFVGALDSSVEDSDDRFSVPVSSLGAGTMSGVELAATAFLNLMENTRLDRVSETTAALLVFLCSLVLFSGALFLPASYKLIGVIVAGGIYVSTAVLLFIFARLWVPIALPITMVVPVATAIALASRYSVARRLLERLAPHQAVRRILRHTKTDRGPNQLERSTIMFIDMVGSTKLASQTEIHRFGEITNIYYDRAGDLINSHGGMIVRFEGDGIFALFTETVAGEKHAARACRAALEISESLKQPEVNAAVDHTGGLHLRFGITTGLILTGLVGTHNRQNIDALGDSVNIAKRLEQLGKTVDRQGADVILISDVTRTDAGLSGNQVEPLGKMPIRGRDEGVVTFRLRSI